MAARPLGRWWLATTVVVAVTAAAWVGTGQLARRTLAASVPPLLDLRPLPGAVQSAVRQADAEARSNPGARSIGNLGRAYHAAQLRDGALAAYRAAEAMAPRDWRWTYLRALLLDERGDQGVREAFLRVTEVAPGVGLAWFRLAQADFKAGRLDEARLAYSRAEAAPAVAAFMPDGVTSRRTWPLAAYAGVALARLDLEGGKSDQARRRLASLAERHPDFVPVVGLLRQIDRGQTVPGSYVPPADPELDALVASSRVSDLLLEHACLAARASDNGWREFLARRALTFNPDDLNVLMEMAAMLQATARPAEALEYLTRHEALAPGDHHALVQQGRVLGDLGRLAEAEAVLTRATAVRDAAAEYNLGAVLDRRGQWDEARRRYERALAINPFHTRAMNDLAAGLDRRGDTPAALAWFEKAVQIAPDTAAFRVNYGSALIQARRFDEAIATLTSAIALDPRDATPHNALGIALASKGDLLAARDAFTRAIQLDPAHANAGRNLERVSAALASRGQRP
ncbi:MAG: tetratricopeptide repeat protein [Acidobacteria bacterium]|nr:tetratricopeptide repeat protein [Acidobacteriota bacterium]